MLFEIYILLVALAGGFIVLGYSTRIYFFSIFGYSVLFILGTVLMGYDADEGVLVKTGESSVSTVNPDNSTILVVQDSYTAYEHFLFGLIMSFVSLFGVVMVLLHTRSRGFNDA